MFMRRVSLTLVIAVLFSLTMAAGAVAQETGTIKGSVTNLTADGSGLTDVEVTLSGYMGQEEASTQTAKVDSEGKFKFEGLDPQPALTYQLSIEHQEATYYSKPIQFSVDTGEHAVDMQLFDSTTDPGVLTSSARHFLIQPQPNGVHVSEIAILSNDTDKTYVGTDEAHPGVRPVRFDLPAEAVDVQLGSGFIPSMTFPVDGGIADTWPVFPGRCPARLQLHNSQPGWIGEFTS